VGEDRVPTPITSQSETAANKVQPADTAVPGPQHNAASDATFLKHLRIVAAEKTTLDEQNAIYRSKLKAAKSDGVDTAELIATLAARKKEPADVIASMKKRVRYLELVGIPVGTQLGLFQKPTLSEEVSDEQAEWDADTHGYKCGKEGADTSNNKFLPGTRNHAAWTKGYLRGQAAIAAQLGRNAKMASTRRARKPTATPPPAAQEATGVLQ
jgi:hypothetical protein